MPGRRVDIPGYVARAAAGRYDGEQFLLDRRRSLSARYYPASGEDEDQC